MNAGACDPLGQGHDTSTVVSHVSWRNTHLRHREGDCDSFHAWNSRRPVSPAHNSPTPYPYRTPPNLCGTDPGGTGPGKEDEEDMCPRGKENENANGHEWEEDEEDKQSSKTTCSENEN